MDPDLNLCRPMASGEGPPFNQNKAKTHKPPTQQQIRPNFLPSHAHHTSMCSLLHDVGMISFPGALSQLAATAILATIRAVSGKATKATNRSTADMSRSSSVGTMCTSLLTPDTETSLANDAVTQQLQ